MPLRDKFPEPGDDSEWSAEIEGYVYKSVFSGATLESSYEMIRQFLHEEGYGDIPLPKDVKELEMFKLIVRNQQVIMFGDNGYVHNPIKILFPLKGRKKTTLILEIFNEKAPDHLLRFHGIIPANPSSK